MNNHTKARGFTLIELLIVIALLGALAVGLLAALDPFEQLKKGTDTGTRNTVSEIHGAVIRYFAIKNEMPWKKTLTSGVLPWETAVSAYTDAISPIVLTGELKEDFSTLAGDQLKNIYMKGTDESVTVCFKPLSRAFRNDPNTKYRGDAGNEGEAYAAADVQAECYDKVKSTSYDCYWCVK